MNCDDFFQAIMGEQSALDPARKAELEEHRKVCEECQSVAEGVEAWHAAEKEPEKFPGNSPWVLESLHRYMDRKEARKAEKGSPEQALPEQGLPEKAAQGPIRAPSAHRVRHPGRFRRLKQSLAAAAIAVASGAGGFLLRGGPLPPGLDPATATIHPNEGQDGPIDKEMAGHEVLLSSSDPSVVRKAHIWLMHAHLGRDELAEAQAEARAVLVDPATPDDEKALAAQLLK
jgi:hypothetical protein